MKIDKVLYLIVFSFLLFNCATEELDVNNDEPDEKDFLFDLTGNSNIGCNLSSAGVDYELNFFIDNDVKSSTTEQLNEIEAFEKNFSGQGKEFRLEIRLVDFDAANPDANLGEVLENLKIKVSDNQGDVSVTKELERLFVCTDVRYGVDIIFNVETQEVTVNYLDSSENQQPKEYTFTFSGSSNLGCSTSLASVDYGVKFFVDGIENTASNEVVNEIQNFENIFIAQGTDFKLEVRLTNFDATNPSKDLGEVLENLKIKVSDNQGDVSVTKELERLFVCTDVRYGVDITYNANTQEVSISVLTGDDFQIANQYTFTLSGTSNLGCDTSLSSVDYDLRFVVDGLEKSSMNEIVNEIQDFENILVGEGEEFRVELRLVNYDATNPSQDLGEVLENLQLKINNVDFNQLFPLNTLSVCTDVTYGIDFTFVASTKETLIDNFKETGVNLATTKP